MPPKQRQLPASDAIDFMLKHELTIIFNRAETIEQIRQFAVDYTIELTDESLDRIADLLRSRIANRLHLALPAEQAAELMTLAESKTEPIEALKGRLRHYLPDYLDIVHDEWRLISDELRTIRKSQLSKLLEGDKDKGSMAGDVQQLIERAQAELQQPVPAVPEHQAPDTEAALGAIASEAAFLTDVIHNLRERDLPLTKTEVEIVIGGLHRIAHTGDEAAWRLGLHAVERGMISMRQAADMLGVTVATVSRRYRGINNKKPK